MKNINDENEVLLNAGCIDFDTAIKQTRIDEANIGNNEEGVGNEPIDCSNFSSAIDEILSLYNSGEKDATIRTNVVFKDNNNGLKQAMDMYLCIGLSDARAKQLGMTEGFGLKHLFDGHLGEFEKYFNNLDDIKKEKLKNKGFDFSWDIKKKILKLFEIAISSPSTHYRRYESCFNKLAIIYDNSCIFVIGTDDSYINLLTKQYDRIFFDKHKKYNNQRIEKIKSVNNFCFLITGFPDETGNSIKVNKDLNDRFNNKFKRNDKNYKGVIDVVNDTSAYMKRRIALYKHNHPEFKDESDENIWNVIQSNEKSFNFKNKKEEQ